MKFKLSVNKCLGTNNQVDLPSCDRFDHWTRDTAPAAFATDVWDCAGLAEMATALVVQDGICLGFLALYRMSEGEPTWDEPTLRGWVTTLSASAARIRTLVAEAETSHTDWMVVVDGTPVPSPAGLVVVAAGAVLVAVVGSRRGDPAVQLAR